MRHTSTIAAAALLALASPALAQSPTTNVFGLDLTANNTQAVSIAGHLRLRYNSATGALEQSIAGGAYSAIGAASTGNWTFSGNVADLIAAGTMGVGTGANSTAITLGKSTTLSSGANFTAAGGGTALDFSAASGTFKTTTGAHTFGSAAWAVTANLVVTGGSSATNTTGIALVPDVADGASSIAVRINNTTSLSNSATLLALANANTNLGLFRPYGTDGISIVDGGGQSRMSVGTANPAQLVYGSAGFTAGSGLAQFTDGTGTWTMQSALMTAPQLKMQAVNSSQTAALQSWRDSAGNAHFGVDAAGLPSLGSLFEWREPWAMGQTISASQTNAAFTGGQWQYTTTANATGFTNTTGTGLTGSSFGTALTIGSGTANGNNTRVTSVAALVSPNTLNNLYFVEEFPAALGAVGANNVTVLLGLANGVISNAHPGGYFFKKASTDTNWQCITDDGTTTNTINSGVAPTASTTQIMRIEYYGSASVLAAKTVKFYIDSTLVCNTTSNVYSASHVFAQFYIQATAAITQVIAVVGPHLLQFNEVATPLIP